MRLVHDTRCTNCLVWAKSDVVVARVLELSPGRWPGGKDGWFVKWKEGRMVRAWPACVEGAAAWRVFGSGRVGCEGGRKKVLPTIACLRGCGRSLPCGCAEAGGWVRW